MGVSTAGSLTPPGKLAHFALSAAPAGWLKANGALVSRTAYAALFNAIGTTFGAGDGVTTFALPDCRGQFLRGFDDGAGIDTGRVLGSIQAGQNASHSHTASTDTAAAHSHGEMVGGTQSYYPGAGGFASISNVGGGDGSADMTAAAGAHSHAVTVAESGGNESRPTNIAGLICIKY